jgi:hypothetical protein
VIGSGYDVHDWMRHPGSRWSAPLQLTGRNAIPHGAGRRRGARAFVFGSRAHGVARPYSNLDLALKWTRPLGLDLLGQIAEALSESDLPYRVGRYTHRGAIANSRLVGLDDGRVSFTWKDYRQDGKTKVMTIAADEFIRRFLQHTVPPWLPPDPPYRLSRQPPSHRRVVTLSRSACRAAASGSGPPRRWQDRLSDLTGHDINLCPCCGGTMVLHGTLPPCPPPHPLMRCDSS